MVGATKQLRMDAAVRFNGQLMPREIQLADRFRGGQSTVISAEDFQVDPEQLKFEQLLASAIRERSLVESILDEENPKRDRLAKCYSDSVNALRKVQDEWQDFIRGLIQVDETQRGLISAKGRQAHARNRDGWLHCITEDSSLRPIPLPSNLSSEVLSGDEDLLKQAIERDVLAKVDALQAAILDQLRRLVELEVCGLIARYPNRVCQYHYFFRRVDSRIDETPRNRVETTEEYDWIHQVTTEIFEGETRLTLCRRIHQVISRVEVDPENASSPIPELPQQLLDSIPNWLRPMTKMVEGIIVSAAGVDQDVERKKISIAGKQSTREWPAVPFHHNDPALVLGQFVLTGWGPEELERNFSDDVSSEEPVDVKQRNGFHLPQAVSIGMAIAGMTLVASGGGASTMGFAIMLLAGLAWGCVYHAEREKFELNISRLGLGLVASVALGLGGSALAMGSIAIGLILVVIGVGFGGASVLLLTPLGDASEVPANQ